MWSRIHLIPLLQAEEDRDLVRRHLADKARERELLGAETKIYNSDRYAGNVIHVKRDDADGLQIRAANIRCNACPRNEIRSDILCGWFACDMYIRRSSGRSHCESERLYQPSSA